MAFCCLQAVDHRLLVDAERRDLAGREVEVDDLVLGADQIDLAGVGHRQDLRARLLDIVAQLAGRQAVGGEGVDVAEDVAELVVEERALHARAAAGPGCRSIMLRTWTQMSWDGLAGRVVLQVDEDRGLAGVV